MFDVAEATEKGLHLSGRICECCTSTDRVDLRQMLEEECNRLQRANHEISRSRKGQSIGAQEEEEEEAKAAHLIKRRRAAIATFQRYSKLHYCS